jgi:transposase
MLVSGGALTVVSAPIRPWMVVCIELCPISGAAADYELIDALRLCKDLTDVERVFANLKDVIDLRPIYHRIDARVPAHIFVAELAFLLHRAIEKKRKATRLDHLVCAIAPQ